MLFTRIRLYRTLLTALFLARCAYAQAQLSERCSKLREEILVSVNRNKLAESERLMTGLVESKDVQAEPLCLANILHELANIQLLTGKPANAASLEERALKIYDSLTAPDDPVRLLPAHILWSAYARQRMTTKMHTVVQIAERINARTKREQAIRFAILADQAFKDGDDTNALQLYRSAIASFEAAGLGNSVAMSAQLCNLSDVYLKLNRLAQADSLLQQAASIVAVAPGAIPFDIVRIYNEWGVTNAQLGRWEPARLHLAHAIDLMANEEFDPAFQKAILCNYAYILKKLKLRSDAHQTAKRAARISTPEISNALIDMEDLKKGR